MVVAGSKFATTVPLVRSDPGPAASFIAVDGLKTSMTQGSTGCLESWALVVAYPHLPYTSTQHSYAHMYCALYQLPGGMWYVCDVGTVRNTGTCLAVSPLTHLVPSSPEAEPSLGHLSLSCPQFWHGTVYTQQLSVGL